MGNAQIEGIFGQPNELSDDDLDKPSHFECLIPPLFIAVCAYLTLDEKCFSLPTLNTSINESFNETINKTVERVAVHLVTIPVFRTTRPAQRTRSFDQKFAGRSPYLSFAPVLELHVECKSSREPKCQSIKQAIVQSLHYGRLQSLTIKEYYEDFSPSLMSQLLSQFNNDLAYQTHLPLNPVSLRDLSIQMCDPIQHREPNYWLGLKRCVNVKRLRIIQGLQRFGKHVLARPRLINDQENIIANLPVAVEELFVVTSLEEDDVTQIWTKAFRSNEVLPFLKQIELNQAIEGRPDESDPFFIGDFLPALTSTIMKKTGRIRPMHTFIGDLTGNVTDLLQLARLPLVDLTCDGLGKEIAAELSKKSASELFPLLERLRIDWPSHPAQSLPLLKLAARRRMRELQFTIEDDVARGSWDDECIRCIASISALETLRLFTTSTPLFGTNPLTGLVSPGCWPALHQLALNWQGMTESQLKAILAGSPNAKIVKIDSSTLPISRIVAMVLHYCPNVARIAVNKNVNKNVSHQVHPDSAKQAQESFDRYPVPRTGLHRLVALSLPIFSLSALHVVLRHVHRAPRLEYASLMSADASMLGLYCTRMLPHLRCLFQFFEREEMHGKIITLLKNLTMKKCIEFLMTPGTSAWFERTRKFGVIGHFMGCGDTFDDIVTEECGAGGLYPVFRRVASACGSRELFYDTLYALLSEEDKITIAAWDSGRYDIGNHRTGRSGPAVAAGRASVAEIPPDVFARLNTVQIERPGRR